MGNRYNGHVELGSIAPKVPDLEIEFCSGQQCILSGGEPQQYFPYR